MAEPGQMPAPTPDAVLDAVSIARGQVAGTVHAGPVDAHLQSTALRHLPDQPALAAAILGNLVSTAA
jgi:hypothetical protein